MKTLIASPKLPRLLTTAVFGALALSCGAVSIASDNVYVHQRVVKFRDLDLSHREAAARLYSRILEAARDVCGWEMDPVFGEAEARAERCIVKSVADAVTTVGHPQLIAIYNAKNRQPLPIIVAKDRSPQLATLTDLHRFRGSFGKPSLLGSPPPVR